MSKENKKLIVIVGTTASGKTSLGVDLALQFNGEIVSADSRQVYKGMDIGTGKDLQEYTIEKGNKKTNIPYHLIDVIDPKKRFTLLDYQKQAFKAIDDILARGKVPILVGGSGLYIQAVIDNYNLSVSTPDNNLRAELEKLSIEEILNQLKKVSKLSVKEFEQITEEKNKRRLIRYLEYCLVSKKPLKNLFKKNKPKYDLLMLGLTFSNEILSERIEKRLKTRIEDDGMIEEVKRLHDEGLSWKRLDEFGLEYRLISLYLRRKISYEAMFLELLKGIKNFAKRQKTWFKRDKRIIWIENKSQAKKLVKEFLK